MNWYSIYGLYAIIREYAKCPSNLPLYCRYEHGWNPLPEPNPYDLRTDKPLMLVWSRRRLQEWKAVSTIPAAISGAPFIHYRKMMKIEKDAAAKGTIAFPAHSTQLVDAVFDIDEYCKQLKSLPDEYQPITICLHLHDIERKKDEVYKKHGFNVVTAGPIWVLGFEFVQKFYDILRSHKYATSNQVGSYAFYAVEMGLPFFIFGGAAVLLNSGEPLMPSKYSYSDYPTGVMSTTIFQGPTQVISEEQREFVEAELGVHDCLSGIELKELLIESNHRVIESYEEFLKAGQGGVEEKITACGKLVEYFQDSGEKEKQLEYILKSFEYAVPRVEFCCHLGLYFQNIKQYEQGIFWYKMATQLEKPVSSRLMWLPHIQLCVCYDRLGKHQLAYEHNEIARKYSPQNEQILHNKRYLERVLGINPQ
ncbi:hypothetical protein Desor_0345 [Desulfosporosinus orientis DSM 765]|uniref:Tetratricopeptide repeat protein n=1 Tax=Desulfosporosinus orientis (strain ATCC 19365 / DSM 765 / NCIMB 8382 / VKM B-1628 / Singapore I) TaxID=768706 RepID=G7W539_DESOD|nr:hypothetical protein [Desulfosporosinus orientis]AET66055.1 hypothetical protein Desor_0345 [Desulfosporosinus orientis DSM 765]